MKPTRTASRVLALLLALTMVFGLAASAYAADDAVSAELVISIDDGPSFSAKIAFSVEEAALAIGAGMAKSSVDLTAYLSEQALVIESGLLEEAYGLDLTALAENLENSVFAPNSGSSYALDQETYDALISIASGDAFADADSTSDVDVAALANAIITLMPALLEAGDAAAEEMTTTEFEDAITINGKSVAVDKTMVAMDNDTLVALWESLLASIESDTDVQSAVAELLDMAYASEETTLTGEEMVQNILDNIDDVRESMNETLKETPVDITVTVSTDENDAFVQANVTLDVDGEEMSVSLSISPEKDFLRLEAEEDGSIIAIQYAVTEDTDNAFGFRIGMYEDGTEAIALTLQLDKAEQTFEAGYISAEDDSEITVSGYYESSENLFSLTMDKLNGEDLGGTITLNLRINDTLTVPDFAEITSLDESELSSVMAVLAAGVSIIEQSLE